MKKIKTTLLISIMAILFIACKKEKTNVDNNIEGSNYKQLKVWVNGKATINGGITAISNATRIDVTTKIELVNQTSIYVDVVAHDMTTPAGQDSKLHRWPTMAVDVSTPIPAGDVPNGGFSLGVIPTRVTNVLNSGKDVELLLTFTGSNGKQSLAERKNILRRQ
jgi:maltose-binding protein MalE